MITRPILVTFAIRASPILAQPDGDVRAVVHETELLAYRSRRQVALESAVADDIEPARERVLDHRAGEAGAVALRPMRGMRHESDVAVRPVEVRHVPHRYALLAFEARVPESVAFVEPAFGPLLLRDVEPVRIRHASHFAVSLADKALAR